MLHRTGQTGSSSAAMAGVSRRAALAALLAGTLGACAAPRHLIGIEPPTSGPVPAARTRRIYIATTRAPSPEPGVFFSGARGRTISFATVDVGIPPDHVTGHVERPRHLPPKASRDFVLANPRHLGLDAFRAEAEGGIAGRHPSDRKLLLWVHGYNTTLTDAVLRLAQFVEDTGYDGVPMLFSWASDGKLSSYVYDINSALIARDAITEVASALGRSRFASIDIVAHSMGNFLAMEAIRGAGEQNLYDSTGKLANVILAAPDIDYDLFVAQVSAIPPRSRRFFVLISDDDEALRLSSFLSRRPRVGNAHADDLTRLGVNVIDLSQVRDVGSNHHSKFADAPEVVQLLGTRILAGDDFSGPRGGIGAAVIMGAGGVLEVIE